MRKLDQYEMQVCNANNLSIFENNPKYIPIVKLQRLKNSEFVSN